jgi:two-component system nitrate/nitrite response regulator NarL
MRVVICDDHVLFLDALTSALEERGHEVVAALPGPDGVLTAVRDHGADCCVLGLDLSEEPGASLAETLRDRAPQLRLLLLSEVHGAAAWRAYESGVVHGMVSKTCAFQVLERSLERLLDGERPVEGCIRVPEQRTSAAQEPLTAREHEVLMLIVSGATTPAISRTLGVSQNTVRTHVQNVLRKLRVHHRTMAAQRAIELGMAG